MTGKRLMLVSILILSAYLALSVGGPFAMLGMGHQGESHRDCPFMPGTTALCEMSALVHAELWKDALTSVIPQALLLLAALFLVVLVRAAHGPPELLLPRHFYVKQPIIFSFVARLIGSVLNPRAP